jgi:ATP-dependent DNA helicase RecG
MTSIRHELDEIIAVGETLGVEFKSDKKCYSDRELVIAVVALANTEGGELYLGIEDNGDVTGLHPNHHDIAGLSALIANRTIPHIPVECKLLDYKGIPVIRILIPKSRQLVSTSDGLLQRRRLMANGKPEAVPFYPHEFTERQSSLGITDTSAMQLTSLTIDHLDPLERKRLRDAIRRYGGDSTLVDLPDDEFDGALHLVSIVDGKRYPTLAGLLMIGHEDILRQQVPAHEVAFQVLEGTDVRMNLFFRMPFIKVLEEIERLFTAQVREKEFQVGLFRVAVPNYEPRAFREALINALIHRDYTRLGAVHIRIDDDGLTISNPGGFVEGVTLNNLLITEPKPRNPLLADITKRVGLSERTGRGIDRIFEGLLRYGRPAPDYSRSDTTSVIVRMSNAESDLDFIEMILEEENRTGIPMSLDSLIVLSRLRHERRLTTADLAPSTQKSEQETRTYLEELVESALIEAHGSGRGRTYTLSARVYRKVGQKVRYVRQAGFDRIQQEQMALSYIDKHGSIKRADVMELCRISGPQAYHLLKRLKEQKKIHQKGKKRYAVYTREA